jgi:thiamine-monophosphate kinase
VRVQLRDVGEFGLIRRIERHARRFGRARGVVLGIGDDAAVLRPRAGEDVVVSTDAWVEDVHFRWRTQTANTVGRRALAAALSDLAAMGARPLGVTCALVAPPTLAVARLDGVVAGLVREGVTHACPLVGGNVSSGRETSITLSVLGAVPRGRALTRSGARAGDRLFVTGELGAAALALARAERGIARLRRVPIPRLGAGLALVRTPQVGGCIDVSDGLEADLAHLLGAAGPDRHLDADLDPDRIPRPRGFDAACRRLRLDPERLVRGGGEDYELLFSLRPRGPSVSVLSRRLGVPVSEIGRVVGGRGGSRGAASRGGWRHF